MGSQAQAAFSFAIKPLTSLKLILFLQEQKYRIMSVVKREFGNNGTNVLGLRISIFIET